MEPTNPQHFKRFVLFAGDTYYPCGGWDDFKDSFSTMVEAVEAARAWIDSGGSWAHVVDLETGERVKPRISKEA